MRCFWQGSLILVVAATLSSMAWAEQVFFAELTPLNDSGVTGDARLTLDGNLLTVELNATGLEPNRVHPQHIHGRFADDEDDNGVSDGNGLPSGTPIDSVVPTLEEDDDLDGFIEMAESATAAGPPILPLTSPPGSGEFPTAPEDGTLNFTETYDLSMNNQFAEGFDGDDLLPLDLRVIELHGLSVDVGDGSGSTGEVNGSEGYKESLPVAAGEIVVPLPAAVWPGLVILGSLVLRRRRRMA